jgi:predicted dienelactone hydrolase
MTHLLAMLFAAALPAWLPTLPQEPAPGTTTTAAPAYDPLRLPSDALPEPLLLEVQDGNRDRKLPLCVYLPTAPAAAPVILFSHGLGGSCRNNAHMGQHWSARGYVVVAMQHPGSDTSVWREARVGERRQAMQRAASGQNLKLRGEDTGAVLDQLAVWHRTGDHALHGRLDLEHVAMSGHSFGAVTTQLVGGQWVPLFGNRFTDARIDAALALSPSAPRRGEAKVAFEPVKIPWLLMTGTEDLSPIGDIDLADRLAVYPALPTTIDRYELVLDGADHGAFGDRSARRGEHNPNHPRVMLALSTAFFDANLRGDAAARAWLHGDGPKGLLEAADRWQFATAAAPEPVLR